MTLGIIRWGTVIVVVSVLLSSLPYSVLAQYETIKIEPVQTLRPGRFLLNGGLSFEADRTLVDRPGDDLEYDNVRLAPLEMRFGWQSGNRVLKDVEMGFGLGISSNSGDDRNDPDQSGIESLSLSLKKQWNAHFATTLTASAFGDDEVVPYGNDGVDLGVNVPFRIPLRPGRVYGNLGYTFKSGNFRGSRDFEDYAHYGIGYMFRSDRSDVPDLSFELVGHETTVEDGEDHLEVLTGAHFYVNGFTLFSPYFGLGIEDGSPDVSVGVRFRHPF